MKINNIEITHPEKILYPKAKIDKGAVVEYYGLIAEYMLPYIKNRPLSLKQYPAGINNVGFFHKHAAEFYPKYIQRLPVQTRHHGNIEMVGVSTASGLVYLAGQNTIEYHMGMAKFKSLEKPDQMIIDFDPSDGMFEKVRFLALKTKEILDSQGLESFVKTTGSRGLHVHIPLNAKKDYTVIKPIAKQLAEHLQDLYPDVATVEHRINKRGNKVFIDYLRNDYSSTAIAPFSLRANEWAGIATTLDWDELNDTKLCSYTYNIKNIRKRIESVGDPWSLSGHS